GVALGGVVGRAEIIDSLPANSISTFGGNPLSCAAAIATLRYLDEHDLQHNALAMGRRLRGHLEEAAAGVGWIAEVRGKGLMQAIETVEPGTLSPSAPRAARLSEACKARSLLIGKGGLYGNVLRIAPPLTVTAAEVDRAGEIIAAAIAGID
ncbi:MAG: aminotransferase class III-fold pyridoxal phosphate-dependent enzyme, partial [Actinomycetota bacterium]